MIDSRILMNFYHINHESHFKLIIWDKFVHDEFFWNFETEMKFLFYPNYLIQTIVTLKLNKDGIQFYYKAFLFCNWFIIFALNIYRKTCNE